MSADFLETTKKRQINTSSPRENLTDVKCGCMVVAFSDKQRANDLCLSSVYRGSAIEQADLIVERPEIINITNTKKSSGAEINQTGNPLPHIHSVNTEQSEKGQ